MPLPTKTLREVAAELGMPEAEIRAMIDMNKIRAVFKKGTFLIGPDEMVRIKRMRKTLPESSIKAPPAPIAKPATIAKPTTAAKPATGPGAPVKGPAAPVKKTPPTSMFGT